VTSAWQIQIPHRSRDQGLLDAVDDIREAIPDRDESAVARQILLDAAIDGTERVGQLLDWIDSCEPAERRALLDQARERAGLPTTERAEAIERFEIANKALAGAGAGQLRDGSGRIEARCAHPDCRRFEPDESGFPGAAARVEATRWWCGDHRAGHEADLEPYAGSRLGYSGSGLIVDLDELEIERERAALEAESRRRQREHRTAAARAEGAELAESKRLADEAWAREMPRGIRP
jgi:hypothetical protein